VSYCSNRTTQYCSKYCGLLRTGFNWWEAWGEIKIEGFGGRPPFGGRPGALGPMGPLNLALGLLQLTAGLCVTNAAESAAISIQCHCTTTVLSSEIKGHHITPL